MTTTTSFSSKDRSPLSHRRHRHVRLLDRREYAIRSNDHQHQAKRQVVRHLGRSKEDCVCCLLCVCVCVQRVYEHLSSAVSIDLSTAGIVSDWPILLSDMDL